MKTWTKTVAGLLKTRKEAQFAINDLINRGVQQEAITLRSGDVEHHVCSEAEETDIEKSYAREVHAQQEVSDLGTRGNANGAKVRVGCGDIATLTELGIPESDARDYSAGVDRGGYLLTVVVDNDRAEEAAEIIRRHGAVEDERGDSWRGRGWTEQAAQFSGNPSFEQPARPRVSPGNEPLSHATLSEQLERAEVFKDKEEAAFDVAGKKEQQFVGNEVSLPSSDIFHERDIMLFDAQQRELQKERAQERELRRPEAGAETEVAGPGVQSGQQQVNVSGMDDEEFQRHFRATYGERGERFEEPYRSAYHFAEAESSSHPQFVDKEWYEVEAVIHRDWEMSHPGTWNRVENAIHFGWDKTRHH
jgi:hypothetical protein